MAATAYQVALPSPVAHQVSLPPAFHLSSPNNFCLPLSTHSRPRAPTPRSRRLTSVAVSRRSRTTSETCSSAATTPPWTSTPWRPASRFPPLPPLLLHLHFTTRARCSNSSPRPFDVPQSHPRPSSLPIHRRPRLHSPRARSGVGAQQAARHHDLPRRGPRLHLHGHHGRAGQRALAAGRGGGAGVRGGGEARGGGVRAGRLRMRYRALLCATRRRTAVE
mmetsp:Transcript_29430/g.77366  ORF Transcript_29430/g.77366 Transcript_29430/m.77366 type:complete len:220 (-) Transcript_29430:253-912(-)